MKKIKGILSLFLVLALTFSACTVFAEESGLMENIESIAENIEVFSRYENVDREFLYRNALAEVIEKNPELYESVLKAMLSSIDENSAYFNEAESKKLVDSLNDEISGIGVNVISNNGSIIVTQPIPNSPAEKAGIKAGDIIIGADGTDLRGMEFDTALEYIRGPIGTKVEVKVIRSGAKEPLIFPVVRNEVASSPLDYEIVEENGKKMVIITLYSFTDTSYESFKEVLKKADAEKINNVIIDLRNNGGGYLRQAADIANLFLPKGAVITREDHKIDMFDKEYRASGQGKSYKVAVLINGMSASAAEVLTAALSENGVAKVYGEKSFGKGTVQTIVEVPQNSMMKYTTAFYTTPLGNNIHGVGIHPDVEIKNSTKPMDMTEFDFFTLKQVYRIGDKGAEIENAKKMLDRFGIFVGEINDIYDENLKIAVTTYQSVQGLYPYGVLDITTQHNLYEALRNSKVEVDDQLEAAKKMFGRLK